MKLKKEHYIGLTIILTEVLGLTLIIPFLPLYAKDLGASPLLIGLIVMSFSLFQFFTSPILGKLSDYFGRKPLLLITQISTCISFIMLGFANSIWILFLSRVLDGFFGSNLVITRAYLSDITTKKDRSKILGQSGAVYALGFMVGPGIGGFLASISPMSYKLPSLIAAGVSFLTIILTFLFIKETAKRRKKFKVLPQEILPFSSIKKYLKNDRTSGILVQYFLFFLGGGIAFETFSLFVEMQLGLGPKLIGYILVYASILVVVMRGIFLNKLIDFFGEKKLENISLLFSFFGVVTLIFTFNVYILLLGIFLYMAGSIVTALWIGEMTRRISKKEQGEILGVENSLRGLAEFMGPLVGGFILNYFVPTYLFVVAAVPIFVGIVIKLKSFKKVVP